jgi:uroporphyrinogen decarboxylase
MAARLEQTPLEEMAWNAGKLSRGLRNAQRLFGYDAVLSSFDLTLEAEACGCEVRWAGAGASVVSHPLADEGRLLAFDPQGVEGRGRLPVVLEATRRLRQELGEVALLGVVTGPLTLAALLTGEGLPDRLRAGSSRDEEVLELAGDVTLTMARLYCELGVDAVLVVEVFPAGADEPLLALLEKPLASVWNVVRYYRARPLLLVKCLDRVSLEQIFRLGADGVLVNGPFRLEEVKEVATVHNRCFSLGIPSSCFLGSKEEAARTVSDYLCRAGPEGFLLSSEWEVPFATPAENLHEMVRVVRKGTR